MAWTDEERSSHLYNSASHPLRSCFPPLLPRDAKGSTHQSADVAYFLRETGPVVPYVPVVARPIKNALQQRKLRRRLKPGHRRPVYVDHLHSVDGRTVAITKSRSVVQRTSTDGKKYLQIIPQASFLPDLPVPGNGGNHGGCMSSRASESETALFSKMSWQENEATTIKHVPLISTQPSPFYQQNHCDHDHNSYPGARETGHDNSNQDSISFSENWKTATETDQDDPQATDCSERPIPINQKGFEERVLMSLPDRVWPAALQIPCKVDNNPGQNTERFDSQPASQIHTPTYFVGGVTDAKAALSSNPTVKAPAPSKPLPLLPASVIRARNLEAELRVLNASREDRETQYHASLQQARSERSSNTGVRRTSRDRIAAALFSHAVISPPLLPDKRRWGNSVELCINGPDESWKSGLVPRLSKMLQPQPRITFTSPELPQQDSFSAVRIPLNIEEDPSVVPLRSDRGLVSALQKREERIRARKLRDIHRCRPNIDSIVRKSLKEEVSAADCIRRNAPIKRSLPATIEANVNANGEVQDKVATKLFPSPIMTVAAQSPVQPAKAVRIADFALQFPQPPRTPSTVSEPALGTQRPTLPARSRQRQHRPTSSLDSLLSIHPAYRPKTTTSPIGLYFTSKQVNTTQARDTTPPLKVNTAASDKSSLTENNSSKASTRTSVSTFTLPHPTHPSVSSHAIFSPIARLEARLDLLERENKLLEAALMAVLKTSGKLNKCPCGGEGYRNSRSHKTVGKKRTTVVPSGSLDGVTQAGIEEAKSADKDYRKPWVERASDASSTASTIGGSTALELYMTTRKVNKAEPPGEQT